MKRTTLASMAAGAAVAFLAFSSTAFALITGVPQTNSFGWVPDSTNALNYAQLAPGYEGQAVPYVLFSSNAVGTVTLDFFNITNSRAFFETRIDGIATGVSAHPIVTGDTIHTGGTDLDNRISNSTPVSFVQRVFNATNYVDIRFALGGESDWYFDWVRFEAVPAAPVPLPAAAWLLLSGLAGLGLIGRRKAA